MLRFLHWAGFSIWLGAQLTFMVWGPAARHASLEAWAHTWRTLAKVQRWVVAPAAAVATGSGVLLTMALVAAHEDLGGATWLWGMTGCGLVAGLLALVVQTPLANRIAALAEESLAAGEKNPEAERLRSRLALAGSVSGTLILAALGFTAFGHGR